MGTGTLLLNASYAPLTIVSLKRGVNLVLSGRAEILEESDEPLRSASFEMYAPLVIRLKHFVKVPYRAKLPLTRKNLIARDNHRCAYCTRTGTTIDHVIPRSRGGLHAWENVVLACSPCNQKKGDKTLAQLGWDLSFTPRAPKGLCWFVVGIDVDPCWEPYLSAA